MLHCFKYMRLFAVIALPVVTLTVAAQDSRARISIIDADAQTAVFTSDGFAADREEALENAYINVMQAILYSGVEGFNGGRPIVANAEHKRTNLWLGNMFTGKNPGYKQFCAGIELIDDFDRAASGQTHCRVNVIISHAYLLRRADTQGVTGNVKPQPAPSSTAVPATDSTSPAVPAERNTDVPATKPAVKKPKKSFL